MLASLTELSGWLTRGTVWLALVLYAVAEAGRALAFRRVFLTVGCASFLAHVVCAFSFYHHWSHAAAYDDTALQTAVLTGWRWGGGLYINYVFALVWVGEVVWAWMTPGCYEGRPAWITGMVRGFFFFMICNGAVVFVHGAIRWAGVLLCGVLIGAWWRRRDRQ